MKFLICGINYAPDLVGVSKYTSELAAWLALEGNVVRVVTAPPYYPAWKKKLIGDGYFYRHEKCDGVDVCRCPIYVPRVPTGAKRLVHLLSFSLTSLPVMLWYSLFYRPDIVIAISPALFSAPGARLAAYVAGAKSWLHIQDFEIDAAFELGVLKGGFLRRLALRCERLLLRSFHRVSSISPQMVRLLSDKGCAAERTYELRNWVDLELIYPFEGDNDYRNDFKFDPSDVVVLYSGNIAGKQGLEILAVVAKRLATRSDIKFLIAGDGPDKAALVDAFGGLSNAFFLPLQPLERLNMLLNAADIHVLPQRAGAADLVLPSKLTGMMASGRPVIATTDADTGIGMELKGCGLTVPPGDIEALVQAILELSRVPERRRILGAAGRNHAKETFGRDVVLKNFLLCCRDLVGVDIQ